MLIIRLVGQTETGSAGAQPVRDNRLVFDRITIGGWLFGASLDPKILFWRIPQCLKKLIQKNSPKGELCLLYQTGVCPIPAEPAQYGVVKVSIEKYLGVFEYVYGLQPLILRPSNPFGSRQRHIGIQGVIPTFMKRMMQGDAISVWGDGSIKRDYLYVVDLAELICKAVTSSYCVVVNAGSGIAVSLNELISLMEKVIGKKAKINYLPGRSFDVKEIVLNVSRASCELGWEPHTSLESGIEKQYNWMAEIASGSRSGS